MAKEMFIEKAITINKAKEEVFNYLKLCRNQENFSVWNMKDPGKKTTSEGEDGTEGFVYGWDSKDKSVGAGKQRIEKIVEGQRIEYVINFERPFKNTGHSKFTIQPLADGQTSVTWDFNCPTKFPMSLFSGMMKKMLGKDIQQSLSNLKNVLEN
jgi:uncharacterized protein YndB with AHSA1/START domain